MCTLSSNADKPTNRTEPSCGVPSHSEARSWGGHTRVRTDQDPKLLVGPWRFHRDGNSWRMLRDDNLISPQEIGLWASDESRHLSEGPRIAVIGESVARGYFYDPAFSLSGALRSLLGTSIEVLDLAKSDASTKDLLEAAQVAVQCECDYLVIMAGNNWIYDAHRGDKQMDVTSVSSWRQARRRGRLEMAVSIRQFLSNLQNAIAETRAQLIFVLPSLNRAWRDLSVEYIPSFVSRPMYWRSITNDLKAAVSRDDTSHAYKLCERLNNLAQGLHPGTLDLSVEISLKRRCEDGQPQQATAARECLVGTPLWLTPRITEYARKRVIETMSREGHGLVDCERILTQKAFLDYCHYDAHGTWTIAKAVVAELERMGLSVQRPLARDETADLPNEITLRKAEVLAHSHRWLYGNGRPMTAPIAPQHIDSLIATLKTALASRDPWWLSAGSSGVMDDCQVAKYFAADLRIPTNALGFAGAFGPLVSDGDSLDLGAALMRGGRPVGVWESPEPVGGMPKVFTQRLAFQVGLSQGDWCGHAVFYSHTAGDFCVLLDGHVVIRTTVDSHTWITLNYPVRISTLGRENPSQRLEIVFPGRFRAPCSDDWIPFDVPYWPVATVFKLGFTLEGAR